MENKKISFGFSKITKKTEIVSKVPKQEKKVELIDCLEGQSIKIKDKIEEVKGPLIIPISDKKSSLIDKVKEAVEKRLKSETETKQIKEEIDDRPDSELTLDELAARELIRDAQNQDSDKVAPKIHTLPLKEDKFVADGEAEATLDDYENVPISEYGFAMLRGMGWKEGMAIGKKQTATAPPSVPELRPKGLGLGANKMVNANKPKQSLDKNGKELVLVKGSFGKIIAGTHRGQYCQVQGFDDDNCRIIVKTAITHNILTLNEFLLVPVTKEEYALGSKVLNNAKYEEFKELSDKKLERISKQENGRSTQRKSRSRSRDRNRKNDSDDEDDRKYSKRHSSSDSSSVERKRKEKKHKKHSKSKKHKKKSSRSRHRSSDSDSDYYRKQRKDKR